MRMVRKVLSICGDVAIAVLDRIFFYKPGAQPLAKKVPDRGPCPILKAEERRIERYMRDEEDRRRRNWDRSYNGINRS